MFPFGSYHTIERRKATTYQNNFTIMFTQGFVSNPETIPLLLHCYLVIQNYSYWFWIRDKAGAPGHLPPQIIPGKSGWLYADLGRDLTPVRLQLFPQHVLKAQRGFPGSQCAVRLDVFPQDRAASGLGRLCPRQVHQSSYPGLPRRQTSSRGQTSAVG